MTDFIDLDSDNLFERVDQHGNKIPSSAWKPGMSGNPKGRPKKTKSEKEIAYAKLMQEIFESADGNAVKFQELVLKNGGSLDLDLGTALRLSKELAPYQESKKASIKKEEDDKPQGIELVFNRAVTDDNTE